MIEKPIVIDLFCGAGGMSEGLIQAGFHIVFSSDINEQVEQTYVTRHNQLGLKQGVNTHFERADIRNLTGDAILTKVRALESFKSVKNSVKIDAIFGGPPCQGFSRAGKRNPDDPRNMLFKEYIRVIDEVRPSYVIMENVEGFMDTKLSNFVGHNEHKYLGHIFIVDILLSEFSKIGYLTLEPQVLDSSDYGVPQKRNRAIFIAYLPTVKQPKYPDVKFKEGQKVTIKDALSDLILDLKIKRKFHDELSQYQIEAMKGRTPDFNGNTLAGPKKIKNHEFSKHSSLVTERFSLYREGEDTATLRRRIINTGINLSSKQSLLELFDEDIYDTSEKVLNVFKTPPVSSEIVSTLLTKKNTRVRLNSKSQSPTVLTLPDDFISPFEDRILSVREMARLQSFDDSFVFQGKRTTGGERRKFEAPQYTQVGNAVPPLLAKAIALEIVKAIKQTD